MPSITLNLSDSDFKKLIKAGVGEETKYLIRSFTSTLENYSFEVKFKTVSRPAYKEDHDDGLYNGPSEAPALVDKPRDGNLVYMDYYRNRLVKHNS